MSENKFKSDLEREQNGDKRMPTFGNANAAATSRSSYLKSGGYRVLRDGSIEYASLIEASRFPD